MAAGRRRTLSRELEGKVAFERRAYLLLPGEGERPAYDEYVGSGTTVWVATVLHYYLNCDATTVIPAGRSLTFEMRLALPASQPGGTAKFGWDVQGGGCPCANAVLDVKASGN